MYDCHKQLNQYFEAEVKLTEAEKDDMRKRRQANQNRLCRGLTRDGKPHPLWFVKQGSYAMHTMIKSVAATSDIDDGVVFDAADLSGPKDGSFSPRDAKQMVRDALDDGCFKQAPEIHTNCVRVFYNDGHTHDMPVYLSLIHI